VSPGNICLVGRHVEEQAVLTAGENASQRSMGTGMGRRIRGPFVGEEGMEDLNVFPV